MAVIGVNKHVAFFARDKQRPQHAPFLGARRDILQVGIGRRQSSRRRSHLIKARVHRPVAPRGFFKPVDKRRFQFGIKSVFENLIDYFVFARQFLQDFGFGGERLGVAFGIGYAHFLEQQLRQLLG